MKYSLLSILIFILVGCSGASKKIDSVQSNDSSAVTHAPAQPEEETASSKTSRKSRKKNKGAARASQSGAVICAYNSFNREISVVEKSSGCVVQYTKDGESSEIGRGYSGSAFCSSLVDRIKSNLESAGFKCD